MVKGGERVGRVYVCGNYEIWIEVGVEGESGWERVRVGSGGLCWVMVGGGWEVGLRGVVLNIVREDCENLGF